MHTLHMHTIVPSLTHNKHTNRAAHTEGSLNNHMTLIMLNSRASCSVVSQSLVKHTHIEPIHKTRLVNADGRDIIPCGVASMTISLGSF